MAGIRRLLFHPSTVLRGENRDGQGAIARLLYVHGWRCWIRVRTWSVACRVGPCTRQDRGWVGPRAVAGMDGLDRRRLSDCLRRRHVLLGPVRRPLWRP